MNLTHVSPNSGVLDADRLPAADHVLGADFGVIRIWEVICRRWLLIGCGVVLGGVLSFVYFLFWPRTYESSAKILLTRRDPTITANGVSRGREMESREVTKELLATHVVLLSSRKIVSEALHRDKLDTLPSILSELKVEQGQTPADYVIENLVVTAGGAGQAQDAHVLNVAFRHKLAVDTQHVVESIVRRYEEFLDEEFVDVNTEAAKLITQARVDLEGERKAIEEEYRKFRESAPLIWSSQQGVMNGHRVQYERIEQQLADLELQATEAAARLSLAETTIEGMKQRGATPLERLAIIDSKNAERMGLLVTVQESEARSAQFQSTQPERAAAAQAQYENLPDLLAKEKNLLKDFGPTHPEVVNTRNAIAAIQEFTARNAKTLEGNHDESLDPERLVSAYVALLRYDADSFRQRQKDLQAMADREEQAAKAAVKYELQDAEIRARLDRTQQLYTAVLDRLRDINLAKDFSGFVHQVISAPKLGIPVWPLLIVCGILGVSFGFILGGSFVVIAEMRDNTFRSPDEVQGTLDLPVLMHVPRLAAGGVRGRAVRAASGKSALPLGALRDPGSLDAEVFRGLRTSLIFRMRQQAMKVLAVTSPGRGDGKSTVAANLAASLAQSGQRVLLIDCCLRSPSLHDVFQIDNQAGLAAVLSGAVEPPDAIRQASAGSLFVLPAGRGGDNPGELLTSAAFRHFLDWARDRYDFVLLDCPAVLDVSDPCIVAPAADGVLLVLDVAKPLRWQSSRAKERLLGVGAALVGSVLNTWTVPRYGFGYRSRYHYRRGYDYGVRLEGSADAARASEPQAAQT